MVVVDADREVDMAAPRGRETDLSWPLGRARFLEVGESPPTHQVYQSCASMGSPRLSRGEGADRGCLGQPVGCVLWRQLKLVI